MRAVRQVDTARAHRRASDVLARLCHTQTHQQQAMRLPDRVCRLKWLTQVHLSGVDMSLSALAVTAGSASVQGRAREEGAYSGDCVASGHAGGA